MTVWRRKLPTVSATASTYGALRDIFEAKLGLDGETVDESLKATLPELGVDSIGLLELETAVKDQFAVVLPATTVEMSIEQIVDLVANGVQEAQQ